MNNPVAQIDQTTEIAVDTKDISSIMFNPQAMQQLQSFAKIMASGRSTIPKHLQGNEGDCMAIIMQAAQWGMNPHAVAQKTHIVNGALGYEAQLVSSVINKMAPITGRLQFEWFGDWDKYIANGLKKSDEKGLGVKVWATLNGEDEPSVINVLLDPITVRNSPLWKADPRQQIAYLGIKRWPRLYCPEVILGVYTPDELDDRKPAEKDITPKKEAGETRSSSLTSKLRATKKAPIEGKAETVDQAEVPAEEVKQPDPAAVEEVVTLEAVIQDMEDATTEAELSAAANYAASLPDEDLPKARECYAKCSAKFKAESES